MPGGHSVPAHLGEPQREETQSRMAAAQHSRARVGIFRAWILNSSGSASTPERRAGRPRRTCSGLGKSGPGAGRTCLASRKPGGSPGMTCLDLGKTDGGPGRTRLDLGKSGGCPGGTCRDSRKSGVSRGMTRLDLGNSGASPGRTCLDLKLSGASRGRTCLDLLPNPADDFAVFFPVFHGAAHES